MEPTQGEKWALAARRQAKGLPFAMGLVLCGMVFFSTTMWFVERLLEGRLAALDFVMMEVVTVAWAVMVALWLFERRCFARLLDAKDQEIQQLKRQRDPA